MAGPGNVQVWETLNIAEINRMVKPYEILAGGGKITITEADKLGINFDMEKFRRHLKMINEQRDYNW
jgi:ABC-type phosphate transport system ATPase subunit